MRPDGSNQISGFMTQITLTGGFANKTLFDQAGVAIPAEGCDMGRLGQGSKASSRKPAGAVPDGARPVWPSADRALTFPMAPTISVRTESPRRSMRAPRTS